MNNIRVQQPSFYEPALKQCIRAEIEKGIDMAADPENAGLPELALRVTNSHSPWYARTCKVCKHKFREGDFVRVCPKCEQAYHDDEQYGLHCWHEHFTPGRICTEGYIDRFGDEERQIPRCDFSWSGQFPEEAEKGSHGAQKEHPRISPSTSLVTQFITGLEQTWQPFGEQKVEKVPPGSPLVGRNCPWCRFRIRAGDWVVKCPCGCGAYFHQDIFHHMTCWNEWNGVEGKDYCPNTGRSYRKTPDDGQ